MQAGRSPCAQAPGGISAHNSCSSLSQINYLDSESQIISGSDEKCYFLDGQEQMATELPNHVVQ